MPLNPILKFLCRTFIKFVDNYFNLRPGIHPCIGNHKPIRQPLFLIRKYPITFMNFKSSINRNLGAYNHRLKQRAKELKIFEKNSYSDLILQFGFKRE